MALRAHVNAHVSLAGDRGTDPFETQCLSALAALAQRTRLATFRALVEWEPTGMAAGDIARFVGSPQNTVSAHLAVLARADLVTCLRRGRNIVYRANLQRMQSLIRYLMTDGCQSRGE